MHGEIERRHSLVHLYTYIASRFGSADVQGKVKKKRGKKGKSGKTGRKHKGKK